MTTETRAKRRYEQIADYYAALIDEGRIMPGYRLPSVEQIRETWTVGRQTAHDALKELQSRGLVEIKPRHGAIAMAAAQPAS